MLWDYDSSVIVLLLRLNRGAVSLESHYDLSLPEYKVGDKDEAQDDQCRIELLPLSGAELEDDVAQDAEADTVGDRVAEHHRDHRDEGGEGFADIGEVEELHRVEHQHADKDECATCRRAGDEQEDGGKEEGEDEEHAGRERGQTAPPALGDTRCALNISGQRGGPEEGTAGRADGIAHHGFFDMWNGAVGPNNACLVS